MALHSSSDHTRPNMKHYTLHTAEHPQTGITGSFASGRNPPIRGVRSMVVLIGIRVQKARAHTVNKTSRGRACQRMLKHARKREGSHARARQSTTAHGIAQQSSIKTERSTPDYRACQKQLAFTTDQRVKLVKAWPRNPQNRSWYEVLFSSLML